jgi:hypothetical protein
MPGGRRDIRERSVTVTMHLLRRLLLGDSDEEEPADLASSAERQ